MGRLSDLITLCSQSSQMLQSSHIHDLNRELHSVKKISVDILRDIANFLGRSFKINADLMKKRDILHDAIEIAEFCFHKALDEPTLPSDSLLKPILDNLIEPLRQLNHNGMLHFSNVIFIVACTLVELLLPKLLEMATNQEFDLVGRFDLMNLLNLLLASIPSAMRRSLWSSRKLNPSICRFGGALASLGDFDLQAHAAAALLRLVPHRFQSQFAAVHIMNSKGYLADHFANMGGINFESEIRLFLNHLNNRKRNDPNFSVVSLSCASILLGEIALVNPSTSGDIYANFWVDFNLPTQRITTYCLSPFSEPDTQFSCVADAPQPKWEILTIHPENIEALDIRVDNQLTTLKFTMSERVCDICDWARSISTNTITFKMGLNVLSSELSPVTFTKTLSEEQEGEVCLIRILQYLKSAAFKMTSLTETPNSLLSVAHDHESIAISPVNIPSSKPFISRQQLVKTPTPDCSLERDLSVKVAMTTSPILCNRYDNPVSPGSNKNITEITHVSQLGLDETERCGQTEQKLATPTSIGSVKSVPANLTLPTSKDLKGVLQTNITSPVVETVTPRKCSNDQCIPEDIDCHTAQPPFSIETAVECLLNDVILSHAHVIDLDETPERQRAAPLYPSPIPPMSLEEPQFTVQAAIQSPPALSSTKQVSMLLSRLSPLSLHEADVQKRNEGVTSSSLESSPLIFYPTSPRALGIIPSAATSLVNSCESTNSFPCEPMEMTIDIGPAVAPPLTREQSPCSKTRNYELEEVQKPVCISTSQKHTVPVTRRSSLLRVATPAISPSLDPSVIELLTPSPVSPSPLRSLVKPHGPPNSCRFVDSVTSVGSTNTVLRRTARRLCDTSVSYLTDLSPANPQLSLTPVQCNDISLPNLSAVVHMTSRTKTTRGQNQKTKQNTCASIKLIDASPTPSSAAQSSGDSNDDDDYRPMSAKRWETSVKTRRRSARLLGKQNTTNVSKPVATIKLPSPAPRRSPRTHHEQTPKRRSPFSRSPCQKSVSPPTPSENSTVSAVPIPLSSLKKRRFFASSRLDRIERERKRFEEAISARTTKRRSNQNKGKKCSNKVTTTTHHEAPDVSDAPAPAPRHSHPPRVVPSRKAALKAATKGYAMPTDSDSEFYPDIPDSQVSDCRKPLTAQRLDSVPETSQLVTATNMDIIPSSWEPDTLLPTSNAHNDNSHPFVISSMESVEVSTSSPPSSQQNLAEIDSPELFSHTPPARHRYKFGQNNKCRKADDSLLPVPLQFVGDDGKNNTKSVSSRNQLDWRLQNKKQYDHTEVESLTSVLHENDISQQSLQSLIIENVENGHSYTSEPEIPRNNRVNVATNLDVSVDIIPADMPDSEAYAEVAKALTIGSHDVHISDGDSRLPVTVTLEKLTETVGVIAHRMEEALHSVIL